MARASGKLPRGSSGAIEVADGRVAILEERGIIGKRLLKVREFPLAAARSIRLEDGMPPHRRLRRLTVEYEGDDGLAEEAFFSQDGEALEAVGALIGEDIERRRIELERELDERRRVREAHVHQMTLVLELLDQVFQILFHLEGEPRWGPMKRHVAEAGRIIYEMKKLSVIAPLNYDANGLATAVNRRLAEGIKEECYALISVVYRDAERLASVREPAKGFDLELHETFVKSYLLLWDMYLGEHLGDVADEEELDRFMHYMDRLGDHAASGLCGKGLSGVRNLRLLDGIGPHFNRIRLLTHQCLNSLIE